MSIIVFMTISAILLCNTSKEISDLEGELVSIRNLLNTQAVVVHGLLLSCFVFCGNRLRLCFNLLQAMVCGFFCLCSILIDYLTS